MRVVDRRVGAPTRITTTDLVALLLDTLEQRTTAEVEAMTEFDHFKMACPRLWRKAMAGELKRDDPFLELMLKSVRSVRASGDGEQRQQALKQAWQEVEREVTHEFVTKKIGAPDKRGRPSKS